MNQKVHVFGIIVNCFQAIPKAFMAAPYSLTICVGEEGENGWHQLLSLVSSHPSLMSHQ